MKNLSIREVRKELAHLDELVAREGEIVVTRRGQPIARLLPLRSKRGMPSHADLRASMPLLRTGSEQHLRTERDEQ
ncbi:MAG: type II toxin-antitoxin system prevent-host-death family antitoxin [Betaproteobacteria bacterium]|nr:type II toxin-antitoxin system prevent-host-death family antitoxin [Betaproteobacteria bacterium]MBK9607509.1 type II toxin-antitoxin system prevent-host-death family antitoxin [Betaproteobacteria bacterium]